MTTSRKAAGSKAERKKAAATGAPTGFGLDGKTIGIVGTGALALFGPFGLWVKGRRDRRKSRREFIALARKTVLEINDMNEFREHPVYSQLRPFLSQRSRELIESPSNRITMQTGGGRGSGANNYQPWVHDDIAALERKWKLL